MSNRVRRWPILLTTAVGALQGLALVGYGTAIAIVAAFAGLGPNEEVSSPTGVAVQVVSLLLLGAGMAGLAWGRWQQRSWSATPFAMAQILGLAVGVPLLMAPDPTGMVIGSLVSLSAVAGLVGLIATALIVVDVSDSGTGSGASERAAEGAEPVNAD